METTTTMNYKTSYEYQLTFLMVANQMAEYFERVGKMPKVIRFEKRDYARMCILMALECKNITVLPKMFLGAKIKVLKR